MRDLDDEKNKLNDMRLKFIEKGKDEVAHLKKIHKLEIGLKDGTARLDSKIEGEKYAQTVAKQVTYTQGRLSAHPYPRCPVFVSSAVRPAPHAHAKRVRPAAVRCWPLHCCHR